MNSVYPFLLLLHITAVTPEGGVALHTREVEMETEKACKVAKLQATRTMNWARQKRDGKGQIVKTTVLLITKGTCLAKEESYDE